MKKVTLKHLKESLSEVTELAFSGEIIEVTKYNKPFIYLSPIKKNTGLNCGKNAQNARLKSISSKGSQGKFLDLLMEDRENEN